MPFSDAQLSNELPHPQRALRKAFLINCTPYEIRVATIEHGSVVELHVERATHRGLVGNIYRGQVVRVLPGTQAAFVEIGYQRTAFLHVSDLIPASDAPIERRLAEGERVLVQISKDPISAKGPRLTQQIALAGRYLVFLPFERAMHVGVSHKLDLSDRDALRHRLLSLLGSEFEGGFIIRTNALAASDEALWTDLQYLKQLWSDILLRAGASTQPALLYAELDLALRVIRDFADANTEQILVDSRENLERLKAFAARYATYVLPKIELYRGDRPLFSLYQAEEELARALNRRVDLRSGGYIVIDHAEALTIVDVNTGGFVGARNAEETILRTNLEAAEMIARQLRLRNLGGIILIDFIDMEQPQHRERVLGALLEALARDPTRTTVLGFTQLGLVELTRKRTRESLLQQLCTPCPACQGRGYVKSAETLACEILRAVVREARLYCKAYMIKVLAHPTVAEELSSRYAAALRQVRDFLAIPIELRAEPDYPLEHYDIVLF